MIGKADFLIELGTEELPPKALRNLAKAFADGLCSGLDKLEIGYGKVDVFATPRRLAVRMQAMDLQQPDKQEVKLGPAVEAAFRDGQPTPAALGFARSCGVSVEALRTEVTDRGERLAFETVQKGQPSKSLLPGVVRDALGQLPVPKMMRWGDRRDAFVRPVKWILSRLGEDVVPMSLFGIEAGGTTRGHRIHAPEPLVVPTPGDYESLLEKARVVASFDERQRRIVEQAKAVVAADEQVVIEPDVLEEVTALVEWPVALTGTFDEDFLAVPEEALVSSMQEHQKYFPVRQRSGKLCNRFVAIANVDSTNPQTVVSGNERVIRPRLADARFFYDTDRKQPLAARRDSLKTVLFQKQLGSLWDKSERIAALAKALAPWFGADPASAERAGQLAKCDLLTDMVGEFPHLQGIMGRYYALHDGEPETVARAIEEQYLPRFSGDQLPVLPEGAALAVAERLDTLVGLFGIGQPPKGTRDPFALRRAALGLLRILMDREVALPLSEAIDMARQGFADGQLSEANAAEALLDFLYQRFVAWYQDEGVPTSVIQAVLAVRPEVVADIDKRIRGVRQFTTLSQAQALAAAFKRVSNLLAKSEVDASRLRFREELAEVAAERELAAAIAMAREDAEPLIAQGDYEQALRRYAELRPAVDRFFDDVMVMADDPGVRNNRLALLAELHDLFAAVADISLLPQNG